MANTEQIDSGNESSKELGELRACWSSPVNAFIAALIFSIAVGAYLVKAGNSAEFYRHLTIGHWITAHDSLPVEDLWTKAGEGVSWRTPNWLFQVGLSSVESFFQQNGFILLKLVLICSFVCFTSLLLSVVSNSVFFGTILAAIVSCGAMLEISLVPKLPALVCFSLLLLLFTLETTWLVLITVLFVALILANSSAWHLLVILLVFGLSNFDWSKKGKLLVAGLLLSVFLTPYFGGQLIQIFSQLISELPLRASILSEPASIYQYDSVFVLLLGLVFGFFCFASPLKINKKELFIAGCMLLLSMIYRGFNPFSLVVLGYVIASQWSRATVSKDGVRELGNIAEGFLRLRTGLQRFDFAPAVFFLSALAIVNVVQTKRLVDHPRAMPSLAVDVLMEQKDVGNIIHSMKIGDFLIYRFSNSKGEPKLKALVDGRTGLLNPEMFRASALHSKLLDGGLELEKQANATHLICNSLDATCQRYLHDASWELLYPEDRLKALGSWALMKQK